MFKSNKIKNGVILFLSSYIPLFIIIIIQNISSTWKKINVLINLKNIDFKEIFKSKVLLKKGIKTLLNINQFPEVYIIIILLILIITTYCLLKRMIKNIENLRGFKISVVNAKNITHEYITNYFAVYIFPFITLDLTSISGLLQFAFLGYIIGSVYIKNELFYVNPTLNILFEYNFYKANMKYHDGKKDRSINAILLSKKNKYKLENNNSIEVFEESKTFYIEK